MEDSTVLKLIPEYSGAGNVSEWLEKVDLVCELRKITDVATVLPLRLTGSAFAVYQQLPKDKKSKISEVRQSLLAAFGTNSFAAYEQFIGRKMIAGESPDVFLANLRTLAERFGGVSDKTLLCAFVMGLPEGARQVLRAGANIEDMKLETFLKRARAVLSDEGTGLACGVVTNGSGRKENHEVEAVEEACVAMATTSLRSRPAGRGKQGCFECGGPNHFARHCWTARKAGRDGRCYECDETGHMARNCPKRKARQQAENE